MTDPSLQEYYDELMNFYRSGELRSLPNKDRRHNATILCFMLDTSREVNMYCGEMSIFRDQFYSYIDKDNPDNPDGGAQLKNDMIEALGAFTQRPDVKLNIIVENYTDTLSRDFISPGVFADGIRNGRIDIRRLDKTSVVAEGMTHCVYTDTRSVRIEENKEEHSGLFLANMSDALLNKLDSNYKYLTHSSEPASLVV